MEDDRSWLAFEEDQSCKLDWTCLACSWAYGEGFKHHGGTSDHGALKSTMQLSNLRAHAKLPKHQTAVRRMLESVGVSCPASSPASASATGWIGAPPLEVMRGALKQFRQGVAPHGADGYVVEGSRLGPNKVDRVVWSLGEALLHRHQDHHTRICV